MNRRKWVIFVGLALISMVAATGCPPRNEVPPPPNGAREEIDISALVEQWVESAHSNILLLPAQRDNCVACHDGGAFAGKLNEVAAIERDFFVSIDCRACHSGQGTELLAAGTIDLPTAEGVGGGSGAQCMACHNSRRTPDINNPERPAPHYSSQADVFTASGGLRAEGFDYGSTTAHSELTNSCVDCHMVRGEGGFREHTFRIADVQAACGQCHQNITTINLPARSDYDGDGAQEGFQDEVTGLLSVLMEAIGTATDGGSFASEGGRIQFTDAAGAPIAEVPNEVYQAAFNHLLVSQDGSLGVHNPIYTVQLLQQAYRVLTGNDVPNATMI
ncbi:MAG: ammonia-forming cytochrome c nitrite reductase subunit c552 [Dethiobacter sp.]|jgi:hypothetical protein|nr:ammonia-forming cytochrome c nitrite reductase subunit c552 [Dethiobacter sp.]MBS3902149.1 ammonia-forming cytochrome c nitrite reductase subunit c552 [Dethiobacter sp.]MBS3989658.1 ammonia-forming cytochrome c nitrite reductase subunit c552 [Dethiobacter sp.]